MLNSDNVNKLLELHESDLLDFKRDHYKLDRGDNDELHKLVKDIICFSNTVRDQAAYIIIGVKELNGNKEVFGLDKNFDDAIIQEKVASKIDPSPKFKYYTIPFEGVQLGILEFPIAKYSRPLTATKPMPGLNPDKIYFRRNTRNSEANWEEIHRINDWLKSIEINTSNTNKVEQIISLISRLSQAKISSCLADGLKMASEFNDQTLKTFCNFEFQGAHNTESDDPLDLGTYRSLTALVSYNEVSHMEVSKGKVSHVWPSLKKDSSFAPMKVNYRESIFELEEQLERFKASNDDMFVSLEVDAELILDNPRRPKMYLHWREEESKVIYTSIRRKFISLLSSHI